MKHGADPTKANAMGFSALKVASHYFSEDHFSKLFPGYPFPMNENAPAEEKPKPPTSAVNRASMNKLQSENRFRSRNSNSTIFIHPLSSCPSADDLKQSACREAYKFWKFHRFHEVALISRERFLFGKRSFTLITMKALDFYNQGEQLMPTVNESWIDLPWFEMQLKANPQIRSIFQDKS